MASKFSTYEENNGKAQNGGASTVSNYNKGMQFNYANAAPDPSSTQTTASAVA